MYGGYAFCIMCHFRKQLIKWFSLKKHSLFFDKETINLTYQMILKLITLNEKLPGVKFIQIWCTFSGAVL